MKGREGKRCERNQSPLWLEECQHHASPIMTGTLRDESHVLPLEDREHLTGVLPCLLTMPYEALPDLTLAQASPTFCSLHIASLLLSKPRTLFPLSGTFQHLQSSPGQLLTITRSQFKCYFLKKASPDHPISSTYSQPLNFITRLYFPNGTFHYLQVSWLSSVSPHCNISFLRTRTSSFSPLQT